MKLEPTKRQIKLWKRLVDEVFEHPRSEYSLLLREEFSEHPRKNLEVQ